MASPRCLQLRVPCTRESPLSAFASRGIANRRTKCEAPAARSGNAVRSRHQAQSQRRDPDGMQPQQACPQLLPFLRAGNTAIAHDSRDAEKLLKTNTGERT